MKFQSKFLFTCIISLLFVISVKGQVANFTADTLEGCEQASVTFTNLSTGATSYLWDFGDGNTSISANPTVTEIFANPGTYIVTLTAFNGSLSNSISDTIHIWNNPMAGFEGVAPLQGCTPFTVQFNDTSVFTDGNIISWDWDFGDGYGSSDQNPSHTYNSPGSWNVFLWVRDIHGCNNSTIYNSYVNVSSAPDISFSASSITNCTVPFTVDFTNATTGLSPLTFEWSFGDGGISPDVNPTHTYTVVGTYAVTLIATDPYGCTDTLVMPDSIRVTPVVAAFHVLPSDTVCIGQNVDFLNDAGTTAMWDFGDGNTSGLLNPSHSYSAAGIYTITMVAAPGTPCSDITHDTIVVRQPPATSFTALPPYYCGNDPVVLTDTSPDAVDWSWTSNPSGFTSTDQNPTATFSNEGTYLITLSIHDSHGCLGISNPVPVIVDFPSAAIAWNSDSLPNHCIPFPVDFTGSGLCNTVYDNIPGTGWSWNFGDPASGSDNTSTLNNPQHIYNTPGEYTITLTVTTATGCTATATQSINIGSHQNPIISDTTFVGCANDTNVHFFSLSTDTNLIDFWDWTFIANFPDSNFTVATSSEQNPVVDFDGLDSISIQLIVGYLECKDTIVDTNAFFLNGPFLQNMSSVFSSCETPFHWGLTFEYIKKATRYYWDFDDDGVYDDSTILASPSYIYNDTVWHDFPGRGTYMVHLIAFNDSSGCKYEDSLEVRVLDIHAEITVPSPHCYNNNLFDLSGSLDWDNTSAPSANFTINYGDGQITPYTFFTPVIPHTFPQFSDTFNVILTMENYLGCRDTDSVYIRIFQPIASFTATPDSGCSPLTVHLTGNCYSDTTLTYTWFSGGMGSITTPVSDTSFTYINVQTWYPSLLITDAIGCTSSAPVHPVVVLNMIPDFNAVDATICLGDSVQFNSSVQFSNSYIWEFGDDSVFYGVNPSHLYTDTGSYTVTLHANSSYPGCADSIQKPSYIKVQSIEAIFNVADTLSTCYPFGVDITNLTNTMYAPTWQWSFGDGGTGDQFEPIHNYTLPGNYWIHFTATTSPDSLFGCKDKDSVLIYVGGPFADIQFSDTAICKGESVTFWLIDTVGVTSFNWSFGDGGSGTTTPYTYQFNYVPPSGLTKVYLIYQSDVNCQKKDSVYINIYQVMANFNYLNALTGNNDSVICQPGLLDFYNYSLGADSMIWSFGDGQTFTSTDSSIVPGTHTYYNLTQNDIIYDITLTVYNSLVGCVDSIEKHYTVYPLPQITVGNDVAICAGSSVQLSVTNTNPVWTPSMGLSSVTSATPWASPDSSTMYHVSITDAHYCTNTDSVFVFVQQEPLLNHNTDTTIIIGEYVDMMANSDQSTVSYYWSPSYGLSCVTCANPVAQPLQTTTYTVAIIDSMGCDTITGQITITVKEEYSLDVPSAFTPNGDGSNDVVYVRGWGIHHLEEFKIYNRWGECVFTSDDMQHGWDGTFKGVKQNIDTYAYTAVAKTWSQKTLTKNGLINLLR